MSEPAWVAQIFEARIARNGGVVRRKISSIERFASLDSFRDAAKARGFHILQHGEQWIVFCDPDVRIIV